MNDPILAASRAPQPHRTLGGSTLGPLPPLPEPPAAGTAAALRALCLALLLAVVLGAGALLVVAAHDAARAQTVQEERQEGVGAWLEIPYPRTPEMSSDPASTYTDAELAALMDKAKSAGAEGVEIQADWWILEPQQDDYRWDYTDRAVAFAEARELEVGFKLSQAPRWATSGGWDPPRTSAELRYWHDFVHDLVSRYGTRITRYKMWNEPNHPTFWAGGSGPNPAEYATLLRSGYLAAKQANPNVTVTGGQLSRNDMGYLNALYTELRKFPDAAANDDFFDELSVHPYARKGQTQIAPDSGEVTYQHTFGLKNSNFWGYRYMRNILVDHGDSHKKIYIGEFGYNTKDDYATPITDEQRAEWLKKAFEIANQDSAYLSGLDWFSYYRAADKGWNIVDPITLAETATFKALREVLATGTTRTAETLAFAPVADAEVQEGSPKRNFGASNTLTTDGGTKARKVSYLRFNVSGVGVKRVQSATLRLYVKNDGGSANGPGVQRAANRWTEGGVNWSNRPAYQTPLQGDKGAVAGSSWMTFDVTNLVAADGTVTLAVMPTSSDGTYMYSKEGDVKPELVLTLGG